eukprot:Skav222772  [mRNA]  locus=scaffold600:351317:353048:- [translate_table: standard]
MVDIISFALGGITVAFLAIVARMGGDCWGAAEKIKEDPKQLYQQFRVDEMSFESKQHHKVCC